MGRDERMVVGLHAVDRLLGVHLQQRFVLSMWRRCIFWRDLLSCRCVLCCYERMGLALPASDFPRGSEAAFPCICRLGALAIRQCDRIVESPSEIRIAGLADADRSEL